jgi:hypothetical protein
MQVRTLVLAAALVATSSIALAQAPIGSAADSGNGAVINRGPVDTVGEDKSDWGKFQRGPVGREHSTVGRAPSRVRRSPDATENAPAAR